MTAIGVFADRGTPIEFVDELRRCADYRIQIPKMRTVCSWNHGWGCWAGTLLRSGSGITQHHASGSCDATPGPENGLRHGLLDRIRPPAYARPPARFLGAVTAIPQSLSSCVVRRRRVQGSLHGDATAHDGAGEKRLLLPFLGDLEAGSARRVDGREHAHKNVRDLCRP
jgi:hypothetical protein